MKFSYDLRRLVAAAFVVKLGWVVVIVGVLGFPPAEDFYDDIAVNLLLGNGFVIEPGSAPVLYRPPLYPLFLAGLFRLTGPSFWPVAAAQAVMDTATAALTYLAAREFLPRRTAWLGALSFAFYPFASLYTVRMLTEPLFTMLLMLSVLLMVRLVKEGGGPPAGAAALGVVFGALLLTRASAQYLPVLFGLYLVITGDSVVRSAKRAAVMLACVAVVTAPWLARNYMVTGELLMGTGGGYNLWLGNHVPTDGRDNDELSGRRLALLLDSIREIGGGESQFTVANDRAFMAEALRNMREEPAATALLAARKLFRFWADIYHPENRWFAAGLAVVQAALLVLAFYGVLAACAAAPRRRRLLMAVPVATVLYFNAVHAAVVATFRYCVPVMPIVMAFAVHAVTELRGAGDGAGGGEAAP
ncbi:MAG TPA: hypothetical protein ENJ37_00340 [Deltaproteobacteria bacterium]|nr:hypothetical protein [Deltaproteobacteria bacterium]